MNCPDCCYPCPPEFDVLFQRGAHGIIALCGYCARILELTREGLVLMDMDRFHALPEEKKRAVRRSRELAAISAQSFVKHWTMRASDEERLNMVAGVCFGLGLDHTEHEEECAAILSKSQEQFIAESLAGMEEWCRQLAEPAPYALPSRPQRERVGLQRRRRERPN
jgi:hypothetical protein